MGSYIVRGIARPLGQRYSGHASQVQQANKTWRANKSKRPGMFCHWSCEKYYARIAYESNCVCVLPRPVENEVNPHP
jgi:hypothetical protein